jgi:UDPglucose 6-dehydrogenase
MNEIANLCERLGGDVENVRIGVGSDHRIGSKFLYPGIGFGGSCFPKDIRALLDAADRCGYEFPILEAVLSINRRQRLSLSHRLNLHYAGALNGVRVAVWGLSFKANTSDVRESAAHEVVRDLLDKGAQICVFDPVAIPESREVFKDAVEYAPTAYDALQNADVLLICTEWNEFRRPNWDEVKRRMRRPLVFDGRNLYEPRQMAADGIDYFCIGRPHVPPSQADEITASVAIGLINPMYMDNGSSRN